MISPPTFVPGELRRKLARAPAEHQQVRQRIAAEAIRALLIPILGLIEAGGWSGMQAKIMQNLTELHVANPGSYTHLWSTLGHFTTNPMGINWAGIVFGLGAVISMGYWTTDFLVIQRVLAAKDLRSAEMAPIIGAAFKMCVPFIVILPGLLGSALLRDPNTGHLLRLVPADVAWSPAGQAQGLHGYDEVLPLMLARYCGPGLLGLGITALIAGFMSGMAGNVSAFTTVWTYDIYGTLLNKNASDESKVRMGRWVTVIGVFISIGTAYLVMHTQSIMDYVQALFSFFIAPLFGTVILGMLWKRATPAGGWTGLLAGTLSSVGMYAWVKVDPEAVRYVASVHGCAGSGAKHVSRIVVLPHLCSRDRRRQLSHEAKAGFRTQGRCVRPDADSENRPRDHLSQPGFLGGCGGGDIHCFADHLLVGATHEDGRRIVHLVFHRGLPGREWLVDLHHRDLRDHSSPSAATCALEPPCQRMVGRNLISSRCAVRDTLLARARTQKNVRKLLIAVFHS